MWSTQAPARPRALVIEDQPPIGELLRDLLSFLGVEADVVRDGATGLARLAEGRYDVVLTDLAMPGLSGWDVVRGVRIRAPGLPVILVTATAQEADHRRAVAEKVPLVSKPFRIATLERRIHEAMAARSA
jgi:CheY-like chemotaxis protein